MLSRTGRTRDEKQSHRIMSKTSIPELPRMQPPRGLNPTTPEGKKNMPATKKKPRLVV